MTAVRNLGEIARWHGVNERQTIIDLRAGESRCTAPQLHENAAALARGLIRRGFHAGERFAIVAENSVEYLVAYLGVMQAGLSVVPINVRLPRDTIHFILRDSESVGTFTDAACRDLVPPGYPRFDLHGEGVDSLRSLLAPAGPVGRTPRIAQILYTSGSTGRPKGVPLSHSGQLWAVGVHAAAGPSPEARSLIVAPLYHMNGLFNVSVALANQAQIILLPRFDARLYLEAVARYRCTQLSGIPTMFAMMAREYHRSDAVQLASVQRITIGSAPLTQALIERVQRMFPNAGIRNGYGTTEAGPSIFGDHPHGLTRPPLALGYPIADAQCRLTDGPSAEEGVLEVRTPALLDGYLNLPQATAERLRDGWYVTGDLMRRDSDGFYYFLGRADDMFVCGGENVYPAEVERMLERHPDVLQAAVVAVPDEIKGHIPIAFVVPANGAALSPTELKAFSLREGPAYSHPRAFVVVDDLPIAGTHKIDKRPLLERAKALTPALGRNR